MAVERWLNAMDIVRYKAVSSSIILMILNIIHKHSLSTAIRNSTKKFLILDFKLHRRMFQKKYPSTELKESAKKIMILDASWKDQISSVEAMRMFKVAKNDDVLKLFQTCSVTTKLPKNLLYQGKSCLMLSLMGLNLFLGRNCRMTGWCFGVFFKLPPREERVQKTAITVALQGVSQEGKKNCVLYEMGKKCNWEFGGHYGVLSGFSVRAGENCCYNLKYAQLHQLSLIRGRIKQS